MKLLETILGANNGGNIQQLAQQFGIGESQAKGAIGQLLPALTAGLMKNSQSQGGLQSLMGALTKGNHQRYLDQPEMMNQEATRSEGNSILGHILGSKDVSRQVASRAAEKTGLGGDMMKKMLPMVATLAMGALSKNSQSSGLLGQFQGGQPQQQANAGSLLGNLLDQDGDGSAMDDLLGFAKKLF